MKTKYSRRAFLQYTGVVSAGILLAACAPPAAGPAAGEETMVAEPQQIAYWTFWADRWGEFQGTIVDNFNESQSDIQVEMLIVPWGRT